MINKERLRGIESSLYKLKRKVSHECGIAALREVGIDDHNYFFQYEQDNPEKLSDDQLKEKRKEYYDKENSCVKERKANIPPELKQETMCLAVGEEIKYKRGSAFIPVKVTFGEQTAFMTKGDKRRADMIGTVFNDVMTRGVYLPRSEEIKPVHWLEATYGLTPEGRSVRNAELNAFAKQIMN